MTTPAANSCETPGAGERFVLLGASNLTLAFPMLLEALGRRHAEPVDVFAAHGHGRSFGNWNRVFVRSLPGIVECGIWESLDQSPETASTRALITDVGNDILYNAPVDDILAWVERCLQRLSALESETVVTLLPLDRVGRLTVSQFVLVRTLLFPSCRLDYQTVVDRAAALNNGLLDLAGRFHAATVSPLPEWYGWDPIHIRRGLRAEAWSTYLEHWHAETPLELRSPSLFNQLGTWCRPPAERRLLGIFQTAAQPVRNCGSFRLWLF